MAVRLSSHPGHVHLIRKLKALGALPAAEETALLDLPVTLKEMAADQDIAADHTRPSHSGVLLNGFACRYKMLPDGARQIHSFHIAGDTPDLISLHLHTMDHGLGTLTPTTVAVIAHEVLRDLMLRHPRLGELFWRDTLVDAAIYREWMTGIGRRTAHGRIAHLFCEMYMKSRAVALANGYVFAFPATQQEIGDALGLSTVHVNRVMQDLRSEGLIATRPERRAAILDWDRLKALGTFDSTYLHMDPVRAA